MLEIPEDGVVLRGAGVVAPHGADLSCIVAGVLLRGCDDDALKAHIGKRGIRYKDRATRLALAAARVAMRQAGLAPDGYQDLDDHRCAVIVASCFGNVDTVLRCAAQIAADDSTVLSPMDLPNASPNVVAATLAIWFGLRGPNLLVACGPHSGEVALLFASNMIRTGAVDRVLVCGAEAAHEALTPLFVQAGQAGQEPIDIAAAVVLERRTAATVALPHFECVPSRSCLRDPRSGQVIAPTPLALAGTHGAAGVLALIGAQASLTPIRSLEAA